MSVKLAAAIGCVAGLAGLAACGHSAAGEPTGPGDPRNAERAAKAHAASPVPGSDHRTAAPGTKVTSRQSDYGPILVGAKGRTLYIFDKEARAKSECYGACATAWPPLLTGGRPVAKGGARQGLLGTTKRRNGRTQVTYAGHPLYLYAPEDPGQILCQNVSEFGGLWLVVRPSGKPVH